MPVAGSAAEGGTVGTERESQPRDTTSVRGGPARVASFRTSQVGLPVGRAPAALSPTHVLRLQRVAGNAATSRLVDPPTEDVQRMDPDEAARKMQARIRAGAAGRRVREQVRVRQEAPGIVGVRVRNTDPGALGNILGTPLDAIRQPLTATTEYNHLRVTGGATQGAVLGPGTGQPGERASVLAHGLPPGTAVINGGYFAHTPTIHSEEGWAPHPPDPALDAYANATLKHNELQPVGPHGRGRPVGPTSHRTDPLPIPSEYANHYGHLTVGGQVGLSSGPLLAHQGVPQQLPQDERFQYRLPLDGGLEPNPRNDQVGALTHASDRNARAAISLQGDDAIMHTVTNPSMAPGTGATMAQWQQMTAAGAGGRAPTSTLNLDGGGSVYLGVTEPDGTRVVAKGQRPTEPVERPVANIIASLPREPQ